MLSLISGGNVGGIRVHLILGRILSWILRNVRAKLPEMQEKITHAAETEEDVLKLELGPLDALRAKRKKYLILKGTDIRSIQELLGA